MHAPVTAGPRVIHAVPGRMRVHLSGGPVDEREMVAARLRHATGVLDVVANPLTGNILVSFDSARTDADTLLAQIRGSRHEAPRTRPHVTGNGRRTAPHLHALPARTLAGTRSPRSAVTVRDLADALGLIGRLLEIAGCIAGLILADGFPGIVVGGAGLLRVCGEVLERHVEPRHAMRLVYP